MLLNAAAGRTFDQIINGLDIHEDDSENMNVLYKHAISLLAKIPKEKLTINVANKLFVGKEPSRKFCDALKRNYGGKSVLEHVNFSKKYNVILKQINEYVSKVTEGKINNLLDDSSVSSKTAFVREDF